MKTISVHNNTLRLNGKAYRCAVGTRGIISAEDKQEGDGCTPAGTWHLRECWYRADRLEQPHTKLPLRVITQNDGWCDDKSSPFYNRHVTLPFAAHHESLWLEDAVYDVIVPLGYNDMMPVPGKGSAIFLHIARPDYSPTEGCVALKKEDLLEVLASAGPDTMLQLTHAP